MRIIAGQWRGRNLKAPKGMTTRPSADRTRDTLFSMLMSRLGNFEDLAVLDLFAGSGALGLEALSRGAASCLFVEQDRDALNALKSNIAMLDAEDRCQVQSSSVFDLGPARRSFDLVLLDPPYAQNAAAVAIDKLNRLGWFAPSTLIAAETGHGEELIIKGFDQEDPRKVGRASLHLMRPESGA
ncbi:16S rRNA (guanine(966)-N(2))-methyltransferase RsmD [Alterisphingorhabdus coralli]|uniref:16S rRNA (Guanine(966)-N(2))-methyltransferase RsmD n=1 Tax=Alterisphingorhabdus coralli TaxID=3071408 RepID=A0AA97HYT0_9SPHN|nr:16S rRNA (guanine(966)-N(2))-methyltransferase RsmD [Parasphingorhabdus sp. SCSIO 66989]WOE73834.1 16S rRNA (guanine(966)-N(2))-methyltransferase RsmD [Parasphingorhabdus sp. SCSIO 66989]